MPPTAPTAMPHGLWESPITPGHVASARRLTDVALDSDGETVVWLEGRSDRGVLVAAHLPSGGAPRDLTSDLSVRAKIGYGGGDFSVHRGYVYFVSDDQRIRRQPLAPGEAVPITPAVGKAADPQVSPDGRWVAFVSQYERKDALALVPADGSQWPVRAWGEADFVMQPRWHPASDQLAWIAWNHPNMPWDATTLKMASFDRGRLVGVQTIAGGPEESILQPEFTQDGHGLLFLSDRSGHWNLYHYDITAGTTRELTQDAAEFGEPAWVHGVRVYGVAGDGRIFLTRSEKGVRTLWCLDPKVKKAVPVEVLAPHPPPSPPGRGDGGEGGEVARYTFLSQVAVSASGSRIAAIATSATIPLRIIIIDAATGAARTIAYSEPETIAQGFLSDVLPLTWTGHDGKPVHGLYYPPKNERFKSAGAPPLVVSVHGGPTSQARATWRPLVQFLTSRGFAVLEVNYRGSTGYGRAYRNALRGAWGVYDVEDSRTGALHLAEQGKADPKRLVILGGSAGGFTVLQSLVDHPGFWKAGVCLYGVSNQFTLVADTHKFEERYSDSLLGPLPEAAAIYRERSPEFHAAKIVDPIIVFQGADDEVVPRSQSDRIVESLKARGVPHAYHVYEGEGHGWRKTETWEHFLEATLRFLQTHVIYA